MWIRSGGARKRAATKSSGRRRLAVGVAIFLLLMPLLAACSSGPTAPTNMVRPIPADRYPRPELLADTGWLAERLNDRNIRIVDLSPLADYERGHIPGAVHVWWQDLVEVNNLTYGMLVDPAGRKRVLERAGIEHQMSVVAYDNAGGRYAARFLWVLAYTNYASGRLLNGGYAQWRAEGRPTTRDVPQIAQSRLPDNVPTNEDVLYNGEDLAMRLGQQGLAVVDTRTFEEGQESWGGRLRFGRIPSARSIPWDRNLAQKNTAIVREPPDLLRVYESQELRRDQEIIIYGLTGVDGAHTYWMLRVLGYERPKLYDGGWAEWGAARNSAIYPVEPLAVGEAPRPRPAAAAALP
jgi:thiosulfate/3-mercaptopyruvate sulfurtransferase